MEIFPRALLPIYAGNSPVTGEFPSQRASYADFDVFFFMSVQITKGRMAADLRLHGVHVTPL